MNIGTRFSGKLGATEGEIVGVYPEGQTASITMNGGAYQIIVAGFKGLISKQLFDVMFADIPESKEAKEEVKEEAKVESKPKHKHKRKPAPIVEAPVEVPVVEAPVVEAPVVVEETLAEKIAEAVEEVLKEESNGSND